MQTLINALPESFHHQLDHIRSSIQHFYNNTEAGGDEIVSRVISEADAAIDRMDTWLLDEEQRQLLGLNPWDVFLLHASAFVWAAYAWQPAAQPPPAEDINTLRSAESNRPAHDFILAHWDALGIPDPATAAVIADICEDVQRDPADSRGPSDNGEHRFDGRPVNRTLLAASIRLAWALNLKGLLTARLIRRGLPTLGDISEEAYDAAFSVTHMGSHPYLAATIQVKIECRHSEIHRTLKHHERNVQALLHHLNQTASPRFLFSDVLFEIEADGYTPVDLKYSVDTSAALKLLTGNRLYSDKRVFLRELIQNAVDACHLRQRLENDYEPAISIHFNDDISDVTVRDNGIGMDRQWIEKYFLTIGLSLYQNAEVRQGDQRSKIDLQFISQFGIGFLSAFLVADEIVIKTRKAGSTGLMIRITNLRDYFDVRELDESFAPGTEVTLHLTPSKINYCRSLEFIGYLKTTVRFIDIPVQLEDHTGKITTLGCKPLSYADPRTRDIDFEAPLAFDSSEGYIFLRAKRNVDHIYAVDTARGGVSVFQDGVFITQINRLLPEGARQHVVARINLLGHEKCELSMDRNRIFWTDGQLQAIKQALRKGLADAVHDFLTAVDAQDVGPNTQQSIVNNLTIFFDFNEVDDPVHRRLHPAIRDVVEKRFRDFLRIHYAHTHRADGIRDADDYNHGWQQRIVASFKKP